MQKPITAARTSLNAVIVTLDNHLSGAIGRVATALAREIPGFSFTVHAASSWASQPSSLEACRQDIAKGDIIIVNMLFLEEHIQAVMPALLARREHCDAMVAFMSAGEVIRLTKLGRFKMDGTPGQPGEPPEAIARQQVLRRDFQSPRRAHSSWPC